MSSVCCRQEKAFPQSPLLPVIRLQLCLGSWYHQSSAGRGKPFLSLPSPSRPSKQTVTLRLCLGSNDVIGLLQAGGSLFFSPPCPSNQTATLHLCLGSDDVTSLLQAAEAFIQVSSSLDPQCLPWPLKQLFKHRSCLNSCILGYTSQEMTVETPEVT